MIVVARSLASEVIAVVAASVSPLSMVAVIATPGVSVVETSTTVVSSGKLLGSLDIFSDELLRVISVGVILGCGEDFGDRGRPLAQYLASQSFMEVETFDESRNSLVMGDLWDLEEHIREASDVIMHGLIFPVPYPLKIILISRLLAGSDDVVDERLPKFLP